MMKIDNKWHLEQFVNRKEAVPSIKFGFIGLGQGGSKIADAFASIKLNQGNEPAYPVMIINSNIGDIQGLKNVPISNQQGLKGYERGVGKRPEVGRQAFLDNGADIFDEISRVFKGCEMIYLCAALGGGTGTGIINELVNAISEYLGIPVASIVTLPRPDEVESTNAYNALEELLPKLDDFHNNENGQYRILENVVIEDNEVIIKEHLENPEVPNLTWDYYSNYKLAAIMHEWNIITSLPSDITIDAADIANHIMMTGGILTFAKKKIDMREIRGTEDFIHQVVTAYQGKNILANGFNYETDTKAMAVCVVLPEKMKELVNQDTVERIRDVLKEKIPGGVYVGYVVWGSENHALVYTMASMSGLPERARNLRQEAQSLIEERKKRESQSTGFKLGGKLEADKPTASFRKSAGGALGGNPFKQPIPETQTNTEVKKNPFRK
jgi:hypothetical protein